MLGTLLLAGMMFMSPAEGGAEAQNALHNCGSAELRYCRLPPNLTAADIETRLAGKDTAWWRDGDEFIVVAKRTTDQAYLCCSATGRMDHIGGDLWALRLHIVNLDDATIDVFVQPEGQTAGAYRGPKAPPKPNYASELKGKIVQFMMPSKYLTAPRGISVYLPPGHDPSKTYPVVYLADGVFRDSAPTMVDPLIVSGDLPPMILVSIWPSLDPADPNGRSAEYLKGFTDRASTFASHESFVIDEVLPFIETKFGASSKPEDRLVTGFSSGASWAVSMGVRHSDLFGNVAAQSIGWPGAERRLSKPSATRFFFSAGTLEPVFYTETLKVADIARSSGHDVTLRTEVAGHTQTIWNGLLLEALRWAFVKSPSAPAPH